MKRFTTHVTLAAALLLSMTSTALKAQISDAPTTGEYVTIQLSQTKDKVLYTGVFAPDNDVWIDLNRKSVSEEIPNVRKTIQMSSTTDLRQKFSN